ncbi:MAG: PfkB family carbohydrate kinase [Verrucomicrobiae bacterium]|nr:PfkB family carbohydrate kinase [Verrucomicrobiae bacterium]
MNLSRFESVTSRYPSLRIAVVGDFCLDRYLEIDPERAETSIETGLPVHNVVRIRPQPGAAGTILNNLVALGVGEVFVVGLAGEDGEGYELRRALQTMRGVRLDHFIQSPDRHTFTYTKPLVLEPGKPPRELNRFDLKNWSPMSAALEDRLRQAVRALAGRMDAFILLEQVDAPDTGVLTRGLLDELGALARSHPKLLMIGDSRRGLRHFPPMTFKMNRAELTRLLGVTSGLGLQEVQQRAAALARKNGHPVFVTMAEQGIVGASPDGAAAHQPSLPVRGEIDIVGAGDAVTANLAAALAAGATLAESLALANAAASIVIHQLGTTGSATVPQIRELLVVAD